MAEPALIPRDGMVACEVCLTEIPASEAKSSEAVDYVCYFCGTECFEQWQRQAGAQPADAKGKLPA